MSIKQSLKRILLGNKRPVQIKSGIAKGIKMVLDPQHSVQTIMGLAEKEIAGVFKKFAQASDVFFDIGAAQGYYGLVYKKLNQNGTAYLFDASPDILQLQKQNFDLNQYQHNIKRYTVWVSNHISANSLTIDSIVEKDGLSGKKMMFKIDVDGGELDVLEGMSKTLSNHSTKIIIETHSLDLEKSCIAFLESRGYQTQIIKNAWWRFILKEKRPIEHNRWMVAHK